jgi:hypothetical protein
MKLMQQKDMGDEKCEHELFIVKEAFNFNAMIKQDQIDGRLEGIHLLRSKQQQLISNDTSFMVKATQTFTYYLIIILNMFFQTSCLQTNDSKSMAFKICGKGVIKID